MFFVYFYTSIEKKSVTFTNQSEESTSKVLNSERRVTRSSSTKPLQETNTPTKKNSRSSAQLSDMDAPSVSPAKKLVSRVTPKAKDADQSEKLTRKSPLTLQTPLKASQTPEVTSNADIIPSSPLTDLDEPLETAGSNTFFAGTLPPSGPQTTQSGPSSPTLPTTPLSLAPAIQAIAAVPPTSSPSDNLSSSGV